jgi:hypothetical protein
MVKFKIPNCNDKNNEPTKNEVTKMANRFKDVKITKTIKFMGLDVEIRKLTVAQVSEIQALAKPKEGVETNNVKILTKIVQEGCAEISDLSEEEINEFAMEELNKLSEDIMKYSGLGNK